MGKRGMTYAQAGVDIDAGKLFANMVGERVRAQWPQVGIGGFAGRFPVPPGSRYGSACTDGDGTKPDLARRVDRLQVVGKGVVAMTAVDAYMDDILPSAFLDYLVVERLEPEKHIAIIDGIIAGCLDAGCQLIGGETAEHPGIGLPKGYFDVGGFCLGFPDPSLEQGRRAIQPGMKIWGWYSHGLGSNGYSLARRVLRLREDRPSRIQARLERYYPELVTTLADALLMPTAIHIANIEAERKRGIVFHAKAHITGGGMVENIPRMLPANCVAVIRVGTWQVPPIFSLIQRRGGVADKEMCRVFNLGIQMVSVTDADVRLTHPECVCIGEIRARQGDESQVEFKGRFQR